MSDDSEDIVTSGVGYHELHPDGKATIGSASFNLINTILGAGILTIPYAFSKTGWVAGVVLEVITAVISNYSFNALCMGCELAFSLDYQFVIQKTMGRVARIYCSFCLLVFTSFVMVSFCIILQDNMFFFHEGRLYKILTMWGILLGMMMPLALFKDINKLAATSFLAIVCVLYIFGFLIVACALVKTGTIELEETYDAPVAINTNAKDFLSAISMFTLCYTGHFNTLNVYNELHRKSLAKMRAVSTITSYSVLVLNLGIGLGGYLIFTKCVESDVLKSVEDLGAGLSIFAKIANVAIMIVMVCSFPLLCFCFRITAYGIMFGENSSPRYRTQVILVVTVCTIFGIVASLLDEIGEVLDMASAIAGIPLVLVFPGFLRYQFKRQLLQVDEDDIVADKSAKKRYELKKELNNCDKVFSMSVGIAGIIITLMGTCFSIWSFFEPSSGNECLEY